MLKLGGPIFLLLLALRVPIAIALGAVPVAYLLVSGQSRLLIAIPQQIFAGMDLFVLMTIPFFILAGNIMNAGNITKRLIDFAQVLVGHIRGGLALVNILSSMFFAGTSGSAAADTSALGSVLIPSMVEKGYSPRFAVAVTAISSVIGPIIPPSIAFIIFAVMSDTSIAALFLAGMVPGILMGISLMVYAFFYSARRGYPREPRPTLRQVFKAFIDALPALLLPVIILGGILWGVFTPTEAAAIAVLYAFVVSFFVYKELKISQLPKVFIDTARLTATTMLVVGCASALTWVMAREDIGAKAAELILSISDNKYVILLMINTLLLLVGTVLEPIGAMVLFLPVLLPIAAKLGLNQVHFGVIVVLNLVLGLATPPVGLCLFIGCTIGGTSIENVTKALWPMILVVLAVLMIVTYIPQVPMFVFHFFPSLLPS